jgi:hypothetical protein
MNEKSESKRYCVIFQLGKASTFHRAANTAKSLVVLVDGWSGGNKESLFHSHDAQQFGYVFSSRKPVAMMRAEFETSIATDNNDSVLFIEIGSDFDRVGFSQAAGWLSRN